MNYAKIDATLAAEIARVEQEGGDEKLAVFLMIRGRIETGRFSIQAIGELSQHNWVTRMAGSRRLLPKASAR